MDSNGITVNGQYYNINQSFYYYHNWEHGGPESGAYVFRPNEEQPLNISSITSYKHFKGNLVNEIQLVFNEWVSEIVRVYTNESAVEFDWLIGSIPSE